MARLDERAVEISAGDGVVLEGAIHEPAAPRFVAVVLHPHPQYGGDMHNHVVTAACSALAERGGTTLRFNFRGTGRSTGSHDGGRGEQDDALAAVAFVRETAPGAPLILAGYSFGAQVAAAVSERAGTGGLVLVSPPLAYGGIADLPAGVPVLAIGGARDPVCPSERLRALEGPDVRTEVVPGVDHGWFGGIEALSAAISSFAFRSGRD
ncbi:MAG TPA: alpha/beta fold hydrolase [Dehalococcoidia bacterium]|nr:alpha/beta fold hydrolase [Dehalococcoidia bacterium]